jgi:hypothetical protein
MTRVWLVIACLSLLAARALADQPFVDPYTASSPSGEWKLSVDPSTPEGSGACRCRMTKGGKEAWARELASTPRECVVSDAGVVVGYAYDNGYMGWDGHIIGLVIGADGKTFTEDAHKRDGPAMAVDPPPPGEPRGEGVILDQDGGRAIIRVSVSLHGDDSPAQWWVYSLVDGKALDPQTPPPPHKGEFSFSRQLEAALVPGTDLVAVHWMVYENAVESAVFELVDRAGEPAWSRRIDREYAAMPERWQWWDLVEQGVRQIEVSEKALAIVSYSEGKRSRYQLTKDAGGAWTVKQLAQEDAKPEQTRPLMPTINLTEGKLELKGEVALGAPGPTGVIDEVHSFGFDGAGRIGWVRWLPGEKPAQRFTLIDRDGKTVADFDLPGSDAKESMLPLAVWLDGDQWLVARTDYTGKGEAEAHAWFLDVSKHEVTPVEGFSGGRLKRLCRVPCGGFVVLGSLFGQYTIRDQVTRYDKEGKVISSKTEPGYGQGDLIMDIAVLTDGTLAILTGVADMSQIKLVRSGQDEPEVLDVGNVLANVKGSGQPYYADIRPDKDGGLIIYDSADENHLFRVNKDHKCWQSFHVHGPKGEPFRLYDSFAADPDGRVWASDGSRLYRAGEDGTADKTLGGPPEGTMAQPVAVTMDANGAIYAVEKGTAAVHVFDPTGKPVRIMRPEPSDTPTQDALAWIQVDPQGQVRYRMTYEGPVVTFSPEGKRLSAERPPDPWQVKEEPWKPVPGGGWEQMSAAVRRARAEGPKGDRIDHRPDGAWIVGIADADAAKDGSLALMCQRETPGAWFGPRGPMWICLYSPDEKPLETLEVPRTSLFHQLINLGPRVLLCDEAGITVFSKPLKPVATRYTLPGEHEYYHIMLRPDGSLATWKSGSRTIQHWTLPAE